MESKKGQIATGITWIVATVAIIVILAIAIFFVQFSFGSGKSIKAVSEKDTLVSKSFFSWLISSLNRERVYQRIQGDGNLDGQTGDLALNVFEIFEEDYNHDIWVGVILNYSALPGNRISTDSLISSRGATSNKFFGDRPELSRSGYVLDSVFIRATERVWIDDDKSLEIIALKDETRAPY